MGISFLISFAFHFFSQLFVRPPQTTILPFCISFSWKWFWSLSPVQCFEPPSIFLQKLSISSSPLNLAVPLLYVCVLVTYSCPSLCNAMDCSPLASSVHGILQAIILEWVAISFSRWSSWSRDQTWISWISGRFFTIWAIGKSPLLYIIRNLI